MARDPRPAGPDSPAPGPATGPAPALRPIRALLRKEWAVLQPRYRAGIALVFLMAALQTVRSDEAYFWVGVMLAAALAVAVPLVEWRLDTRRLLASLPATRTDVVVARYLAAGTACGLAWVLWIGTGAALGALLDLGAAGAVGWATLPGALTFAIVTGLLLAAFLPIHFAFGFGRAGAVFLPVAVGLVLGGRALAGRVLAGGPAPGAADLGLSTGPPAAVIHQGVAALVEGSGGSGVAALTAMALAGLWAVSAWVSARAYGRRGL